MTNKPKTEGADTALKISKLLKKLITCLTQETLALQAHNIDIAERMRQEKTILLTNYKNVQQELVANPDIFQNIDEDIKTHLHDLTAEFELVLRDNIVAIETGKGAVTRLINRILKKIRETAVVAPKAYDNKGKIVETALQTTITPTQLNETY